MSNIPAAVVALARRGIKRESQEHYASLRKKLTSAINPDTGQPFKVTMEDFVQFLTRPEAQVLSHRYVERLHSAVRDEMTVHQVPYPPEQQELVRRVIRGFKNENDDSVRDRGAISCYMFRQMVNMLRRETKRDYSMAIEGLALQWTFGLRAGQVSTVRRCQLRLAQKGCWIYTGPRDKARTDAQRASDETHLGSSKLMDLVMPAITRCQHPEDYVCPSFTPGGATEAVQLAATRLRWDKTLTWCSHSVRHGSLADAYAEGGLDAVRERGAHDTEAMQLFYSRSNDERQRGAPKGAATAASPTSSSPSTRETRAKTARRKARVSVTKSRTATKRSAGK